jgi:hypothetical protein
MTEAEAALWCDGDYPPDPAWWQRLIGWLVIADVGVILWAVFR